MLQSLINTKVIRGLSRAADIVGSSHALYRPLTSLDPVGGTPFGSLYCAFDATPEFKLSATAQPNHPFTVLLADPSAVRQGDYLVADTTHFIARVEPLRAALCVLCDHTLDFLTSDIATNAGTNSYGGQTSGNDVLLAQAWPVSMTARTRGEADVTKLPSDTRAAYYDILVPPIPGLSLTFGMQLRDPSGQKYEIVSADFSSFGWRLLAGLTTT